MTIVDAVIILTLTWLGLTEMLHMNNYLPIIKKYILDTNTVKVLATTDVNGTPHVVVKNSFTIDREDRLLYLELLEGSTTNKNMIYSLWFNKLIAINMINDKRSIQIKGVPSKAIVSGKIFEQYYLHLQQKDSDDDLATIYYINIVEVIDQSYLTKREIHKEQHPLYLHIDRLAR